MCQGGRAQGREIRVTAVRDFHKTQLGWGGKLRMSRAVTMLGTAWRPLSIMTIAGKESQETSPVPGLLAGSSSRPSTLCCDLGQPEHLWRSPRQERPGLLESPSGASKPFTTFHVEVAPPQRMNTCSSACRARHRDIGQCRVGPVGSSLLPLPVLLHDSAWWLPPEPVTPACLAEARSAPRYPLPSKELSWGTAWGDGGIFPHIHILPPSSTPVWLAFEER